MYNPGDVKSFTVSLSGGAYDSEWFNPSSGAVASRGKVRAIEGPRCFTAPFDGDALLYLEKRSNEQ